MGRRPIILGLTGSIAMGKTTAAAMFRHMGVRVFEADRVVHRLFTDAGVVAEIAKMFPEAVKGGTVDRKALGAAVFGDQAALKKLEAVLHPGWAGPNCTSSNRPRLGVTGWWCSRFPCCSKPAVTGVVMPPSWSPRRDLSRTPACAAARP